MTDSSFWRPLASFQLVCKIQRGFQKPLETPLGMPLMPILLCGTYYELRITVIFLKGAFVDTP